MARKLPTLDGEIVRGLLDALAEDRAKSQRGLASELNVALGLVNAYLKRCVTKGLVKVSAVPARRYAYYLTAKGFSEKARLTTVYLSNSFAFFREARADFEAIFSTLAAKQSTRVTLVGRSELAEIAVICALDKNIQVVAIVDKEHAGGAVAGVPVFADFARCPQHIDAAVITGLLDPDALYLQACNRFGKDQVFIPKMLAATLVRTLR
ncbi:winged helix-turn-helix transcriptional regulator [Hyphomicrobium album]|uniref:winged helix-turn-helix transcriptional regulator n=1 Tax=Hyphomicrobium album TaxID=2665159 RepID=UPI002D21B1AA|nr:winged helix-turn-helix transcriptional regulator [Hyphomicrobium album]